ncbi:MAG: pyroglutamyl-peptidase I, partial [Veillonella sp.]|nr:pyroglutamyl-peptidase I [Veillonella sp.]
MKTILITGFDPFGGEPINPAWEAVKTMDGYTDGDYKVVTQMVPTIRYKSVDT